MLQSVAASSKNNSSNGDRANGKTEFSGIIGQLLPCDQCADTGHTNTHEIYK